MDENLTTWPAMLLKLKYQMVRAFFDRMMILLMMLQMECGITNSVCAITPNQIELNMCLMDFFFISYLFKGYRGG